jgi:hypothetical protein
MGGTAYRRVVLILSVDVAALAPPGVTEAGNGVHVARAGMPLQESATAELYPETEFTVTVTLAELPATSVVEVGATATPKSEPWPVSLAT